MVLTGPTLTLRYATAEDAPRLLELASDPLVTQLVLVGPVRVARAARGLHRGAGRQARGRRAARLPDRAPRGRRDRRHRPVELAARDRRATVGTWFGREWWGSGVNRESKAMIAALAFGRLGPRPPDRVGQHAQRPLPGRARAGRLPARGGPARLAPARRRACTTSWCSGCCASSGRRRSSPRCRWRCPGRRRPRSWSAGPANVNCAGREVREPAAPRILGRESTSRAGGSQLPTQRS